jgi:hypothetical protein
MYQDIGRGYNLGYISVAAVVWAYSKDLDTAATAPVQPVEGSPWCLADRISSQDRTATWKENLF